MGENQLTIKFGGDGNIKISTLTEFLEIYKDLLYIINHELGYDSNDLIIEVSPPENGSFKIKLSPKYEKIILQSITAIVVSTLSGLLVYYLTNTDEDKTLKEIRDILENQAKTDKDIPKSVINIYQNTNAKSIINKSFIIVNNDENITDLKIDEDNKEIINVPRSQFRELIKEVEIIEAVEKLIEEIIRDEVILIIKTVHFEGNAKWAFVYRGYPIKAVIKDEDFILKLNDESFRKGDSLKVLLATKRNFDNELQTYIVDQNSYVIEKVIEHKSKTDNQNKLNLK